MITFRHRFAALAAALLACASLWSAPASAGSYQYRIPIEGLTAPALPAVDSRPAVELQALTDSDFGAGFTHDLLSNPLQREFILVNLSNASAQVKDVQVSGSGFSVSGGTCTSNLLVEGKGSCSIVVNFQSTESLQPSMGELRVTADVQGDNVSSSLSATAITAFRDAIAGTAAVLSNGRLTASWGASSSAGSMRVGVGQRTGQRYVELTASNSNLAVGVSGNPGLVALDLASGTLLNTMSPAPAVASGSIPKIGTNDRIGLAIDFSTGEADLFVNCIHRTRLKNIPTQNPLAVTIRKPNAGAQSVTLNAGGHPFQCAVPVGYKAGW